MIEFKEVKISRILNPTSINLGEYVINPYLGCELSCLYCYVRFNKVVSKKDKPWGTYVEIRTNSPQLLEKEIALRKPSVVLLGSTTECFQPIEAKYQLSKKILEVLNKYKVYFVILTRSPYILEYLPLLTKGFCKRIYFTINNMPDSLKAKLELKSPAYEERMKAIDTLIDYGVPVVPYFSPVLPWMIDFKSSFLQFPKANLIEFEGLNFRMGNIKGVINAISSGFPHLKAGYERLLSDEAFYKAFWNSIKKIVIKEALRTKKGYNIYIHNFGSYFKNIYVK